MSVLLSGSTPNLDLSGVEKLFSQYGEITNVINAPQGWIVDFANQQDAANAFEGLKDKFQVALLKKVSTNPQAQVTVYGLHSGISAEDLADAFGRFGRIKTIFPGTGYWVIEFENVEDAERARDDLKEGMIIVENTPPPVRAFKNYLRYVKSLKGTPDYYNILERLGSTLGITPGGALDLVEPY